MSVVYDKKIQKLRDEANKLMDKDAIWFYVLEVIEGIYSINQLKTIVASFDEFRNHFLDKCPSLVEPTLKSDDDYDDLADLDVLVVEVYDCLIRFIAENSVVCDLGEIDTFFDLNSDKYKVSFLPDFEVSSDLLEALMRTDENNMVAQSLLLHNPFEKKDGGIASRLGEVPIIDLKKVLIQTDGNVSLVLKYFGFGDEDSALFKSLKKSLVPAMILYSQASLRNSIGADELSDNLYLIDLDKKRPFIEHQLVTLAKKVCSNPNENYIFGKLSSKDQKRIMGVVKASSVATKGLLCDKISPLFSTTEVLSGLSVSQVDLLDEFRRNPPKVRVKMPPEDRLFLIPRNLS